MNVKRKVGWIALGLLVVLVIMVVGGNLYLRTNSFQRFAISKIVEQANSATGGKTEIGRLDLDLKTLTAHLYNITLRGTESSDQPSLLHVDELTARIKIGKALRPKVSLRELLIDHPVVHVEVNRAGKNNFPTPPKQSSSHTNVFDLAVNHVAISNGEIAYKDQKIPLDADLYDLGTDIHFVPLTRSYDGNLSYRNGHLHYARYSPLQHNLSLQFSASEERFDLRSLTMNVGQSEANLTAQLSNYSSPVADGDYHIRIHTQDFAAMSPSVSPAGDVMLTGKLHYRSAENEPLLRTVSVVGDLASEFLRTAASGKRVELRRLEGSYRLANGNLDISRLTTETFGGTVLVSAAMKHLDGTPQSDIRADLQNISLSAIQRAITRQELSPVALSGTLEGKVTASWTGSIANLRARSDIIVRAKAAGRANRSGPEAPVNGALHVSYDGPRQTIEVRDTSFRLPAATLTAQGLVSDHSNLQMQVIANDLHQLAALASSFSSNGGQPPAVSGSARVDATVRGSMKAPAVTAQLTAQNLQVEGSQWTNARIAMHADPSIVVIDRASLVSAQRGQATLTASVALKNWAYSPSNELRADLKVQQLQLSDLQKLANQNYPISGDLSANVKLSGSQLQPAGSGSVSIANARAYGESLKDMGAQFKATNGSIVAQLNVSAEAGAVDADLSYTPKTKGYKVQLNAPSIVLQKLTALQEKNLGITGTISASVNGEGTLDNPELAATLQLPELHMRQTVVSGLRTEIKVAQHRAQLDLDTRVSAASIHAHGEADLSGDYESRAVIDTGTIPLAALLATYAPSVPQGFQGQTELHASLQGPLKQRSRLQAHLSIPVLQAKYQQLEIGIARPIQVDYENSAVTLQPAELRGTETSLRAQGRIPIGGSEPPTLTAQGSIDMRIVQILAPTVQSSGVLALDVRSSGAAPKPEIQGQVQLKNVALATASAPIGISQLNGTLDIKNDRVQVTNMTAQMGGGQVSLGGSVAYKPKVEFNLAVEGKSVRLLYPEGLRSILDSNLTFSGTTQASVLSGRVLIDSLSFTPDFDLASFSDQFSTPSVPAQPGFADTVRLAVAVQSRSNLNAVSSQISISGQAALQVRGTAADPVITGRTTLNSGELFFRNVRYQLERGIITFDDPNQTHPVLNVSVATTIQQYNLTLTLRGPIDKLTTSYVSDPPLATADIINLVARGKTTEEQAASSQSTDSMIASQVAGQLSSSVQKLAGISSLEIDPTLGGNNTNPSARIAFQQRVTKNLLFSFSTDVSQPGNEIVQGEYQINKRWSVSVARDQLGGVSVDGKYHKRF